MISQIVEAEMILTKNLSDRKAGRKRLMALVGELGWSVECYPCWHPILTLPHRDPAKAAWSCTINTYSGTYAGADHVAMFARGFVSCTYKKQQAEDLVESVQSVPGLSARHLGGPLYTDNSFVVVVVADDVELQDDGTICERDALIGATKAIARIAETSNHAEEWDMVKGDFLGSPHGDVESLLINAATGQKVKSLVEMVNDIGVFGPVLHSVDFLPKEQRDAACERLLRAANAEWRRAGCDDFTFELQGEPCRVRVRDISSEHAMNVFVGESPTLPCGYLLMAWGYVYLDNDTVRPRELEGIRDQGAAKFL